MAQGPHLQLNLGSSGTESAIFSNIGRHDLQGIAGNRWQSILILKQHESLEKVMEKIACIFLHTLGVAERFRIKK